MGALCLPLYLSLARCASRGHLYGCLRSTIQREQFHAGSLVVQRRATGAKHPEADGAESLAAVAKPKPEEALVTSATATFGVVCTCVLLRSRSHRP